MAIQNKIVIELAKKIIDNCGNLLNAIDEIEEAYRWGSDAGINFAVGDFPQILSENGDTQHTEAIYLNQAAGVIVPALLTWLDTEQAGGEKYRAILQHNRKG